MDNAIEKMKTGRSIKRKISDGILFIILIVVALIMVVPFIWMVSASFKSNNEIFLYPIRWIPDPVRFKNYVSVWTEIPFLKYFTNTLIYSVIVTEKRTAYHYERNFTDLGLNPRETDILVVKIGYLVPELYDMRADWLMALTPGGVDQDLLRLPYKRINRPMYPLDPDMADPDLSAQFIPLSDEIKR